jgi:6-pyruvoyltetrahydropterin/6-carboxytetrahydropterin synthase
VICSSHLGGSGVLHGHNFRVVAVVEAEALDARGSVLSVAELRAALHAVLDPLDHRHLDDLEPFAGRGAMSAVLARYAADALQARIGAARIARVEVWPTATLCASWTP